MIKLNIFKMLSKTKVEGPGIRFCIWVQGCSKRCKGCFATNTWSHKENMVCDVDMLYSIIRRQRGIEGVTFLGGEPFEQPEALSILAEKLQKARLSVVTFTVLNYEDLKASKNKHIQNLLKYTDLLIDGGFEEDKFDLSRPWVGSKNQRYLFLSNRYSMEDVNNSSNKLEVRMNKSGFIFVNGMNDFKKIKDDTDDFNSINGVKYVS